MAVAESAYPIVDDASYKLENAEVLAREIGTDDWTQLGDVDSARAEIAVTKITRKAKNRKVRSVAKEIITDVAATLALKAMQWIDLIAAISLMGKAVAHTQVVGPWTLNIKEAKRGGLYFVGALDIDMAVTAKESVYDENTKTFTAGGAIAGLTFTVVDQALGGIILTGGFADGDTIQIAGTCQAITAEMGRTRIEFASRSNIELEVMIRGVSETGSLAVMHFYKWVVSPSGVDFISADDFTGQDITGSVVLTNRGIGTYQVLGVS